MKDEKIEGKNYTASYSGTTVTNTLNTKTLSFTKTDDAGTPLEGAVFGLYRGAYRLH